MRNPLEAISEWNDRRWRTHGIKAWERRRTKGVWLFVLMFGAMWGAWMAIVLSLVEYLFDGTFRVESLKFTVPFYLIGGFIVGLAVWWGNENRYRKHTGGKS
jgi:hypothetical protein